MSELIAVRPAGRNRRTTPPLTFALVEAFSPSPLASGTSTATRSSSASYQHLGGGLHTQAFVTQLLFPAVLHWPPPGQLQVAAQENAVSWASAAVLLMANTRTTRPSDKQSTEANRSSPVIDRTLVDGLKHPQSRYRYHVTGGLPSASSPWWPSAAESSVVNDNRLKRIQQLPRCSRLMC